MIRSGYFLLERLTQPELEPVTLAEMKRHLRQFVGVTTEDGDVSAAITMAREWVEHYTGRVCIDQSWRLTVRQLPFQCIGDVVAGFSGLGCCGGPLSAGVALNAGGAWLRRSPVLAITSYVTIDANGVETTVDPDTYVLRDGGSKWPRLAPLPGAAWTAGDFKIEFRAGFADRTGSPVTGEEVVPGALKHAIKLIVANFDENRAPVVEGQTVNELPLGIQWLLGSEKCDLGLA